jgi:hypothetical protein
LYRRSVVEIKERFYNYVSYLKEMDFIKISNYIKEKGPDAYLKFESKDSIVYLKHI